MLAGTWFDALFRPEVKRSQALNALTPNIDDVVHELRRRGVLPLTTTLELSDYTPRKRTDCLFTFLDRYQGDGRGRWLGDIDAVLRSTPGMAALLGAATSPSRPLKRAAIPYPPDLCGRTKELQQVVEAICHRSPRAVAITGIGGQGKTTLALHALRSDAVVNRYGDQRFFVSCEGRSTASDIVAAIAQSLGLPHNTHTTAADVMEHLHGEELIALLLDNFEDAAHGPDGANVRRLLMQLLSCDHLALILTMRGERPHLATTRWAAPLVLGGLDLAAAYSLFRQHAPSLPLPVRYDEHSPEGSTIADLATTVGAHPLCVQLVAARCDVAGTLGPARAIADRDDLEDIEQPDEYETESDRFSSLGVCLSTTYYESPLMTTESCHLLFGLAMLLPNLQRHDLLCKIDSLGAIFPSVSDLPLQLRTLIRLGLIEHCAWDGVGWRAVTMTPAVARFAMNRHPPSWVVRDVWIYVDNLVKDAGPGPSVLIKQLQHIYDRTSLPSEVVEWARSTHEGLMALSRLHLYAVWPVTLPVVHLNSAGHAHFRAAIRYALTVDPAERDEQWIRQIFGRWGKVAVIGGQIPLAIDAHWTAMRGNAQGSIYRNAPMYRNVRYSLDSIWSFKRWSPRSRIGIAVWAFTTAQDTRWRDAWSKRLTFLSERLHVAPTAWPVIDWFPRAPQNREDL